MHEARRITFCEADFVERSLLLPLLNRAGLRLTRSGHGSLPRGVGLNMGYLRTEHF
ncbi:hypothetical protein DPMN_058060 [Dreissena polymorpha]|uniref:Uncharacterized protein n=1 Tax=Dreissena polymorpha TaxID=45954 RepID=A0A9D4HF07_DREPO|nr:hypothetical protein DPMN_058060 [Dreissena polymorpha]